MTSQLDVREINVSYDGSQVLNQVSFSVEPGQIGCILGLSGCGKTTALRAIAGFEPVSGGRIHIDGVEVSSSNHCLAPEKRNIGMVFQDFALFPNMSVADNIRFGLRNWSRQEQDDRIQTLLNLVGMPEYGDTYSHQISGGQQQRVALARAMAPRPRILLMDEPFSSLDVDLREQLARDVRKILNQENITAILVTHDQHEAFAMADEICVMHEGKIQQQDTGYNLYHYPKNHFVANFIGKGVILGGSVDCDKCINTDLGCIKGNVPPHLQEGDLVDLLIRPDDVVHDDSSGESAIVVEKAFRGSEFLYLLRMDTGTEVLCLAPSHHNHKISERIGVRLEVEDLVVFDRVQESGRPG